jgi:hypothetical protein
MPTGCPPWLSAARIPAGSSGWSRTTLIHSKESNRLHHPSPEGNGTHYIQEFGGNRGWQGSAQARHCQPLIISHGASSPDLHLPPAAACQTQNPFPPSVQAWLTQPPSEFSQVSPSLGSKVLAEKPHPQNSLFRQA